MELFFFALNVLKLHNSWAECLEIATASFSLRGVRWKANKSLKNPEVHEPVWEQVAVSVTAWNKKGGKNRARGGQTLQEHAFTCRRMERENLKIAEEEEV